MGRSKRHHDENEGQAEAWYHGRFIRIKRRRIGKVKVVGSANRLRKLYKVRTRTRTAPKHKTAAEAAKE